MCSTSSDTGREISLCGAAASSTKPSVPAIRIVIVVAAASASVKPSSNSRMNGPSAAAALLSLASGSSSALDPSMSRRLASLPRVAPFGVPSRSMTRASSGSGLFQVEMPAMPTSEPCPTLLSSGPLVNTSGWMPSPTWRYWDQNPFSRSSSSTASASSEPGRTSWIELPMLSFSCSRISAARVMSPPTRSSMTRSTMLRTNVTPAALRTCRSTGESSAGCSRSTGPAAPRRRSASAAVAVSTSPRS